jgi:hypothetical protein
VKRCAWARARLAELGAAPVEPPAAGGEEPHEAAWDRSGALALTGLPDRILVPRAPAPQAIEGALLGLRSLAPGADLSGLDARLLGERAALAGLSRRGATAPGGQARLVSTRTGWIAPNLPRPDDWRSVPAWLEAEIEPGDWSALEREVAARDAGELLARGRQLGLAVGCTGEEGAPRSWCVRSQLGEPTPAPLRPWVLDLSALWAGPLCSDLLRRAGARVTKLESRARPDGARRGSPAFFDLLNAGKESVALDLGDPRGRLQLKSLIERVDVVLESARPRALSQLGVDAAAWVGGRAGRVWCSLTGYGRGDPQGGWVAFGDDAAVSGGLVEWPRSGPVFVGDAIADPLTGVHAALAVQASLRRGGGELLDVALSAVAHLVAEAGLRRGGEPQTYLGVATPPSAPRRAAAARPLGADNPEVLS